MAAPEVSGFGDGSHAIGENGITVSGGGFGGFPGSVWVYENSDRTGLSDELSISSWNDLEITINFPGSMSNSAGTRYVFVLREDLAWSNEFAFTLTDAVVETSDFRTAGGEGARPPIFIVERDGVEIVFTSMAEVIQFFGMDRTIEEPQPQKVVEVGPVIETGLAIYTPKPMPSVLSPNIGIRQLA